LISSEFINGRMRSNPSFVVYVLAGPAILNYHRKGSSLQAEFDVGFANIRVPGGRELGLFRRTSEGIWDMGIPSVRRSGGLREFSQSRPCQANNGVAKHLNLTINESFAWLEPTRFA